MFTYFFVPIILGQMTPEVLSDISDMIDLIDDNTIDAIQGDFNETQVYVAN